jgi:hypothetical protein
MGPHRRLGISVGYQSLSILKYPKPLMGDILALKGDNKFIDDGREIVWDEKNILSSNPCTKETELQVQKILELQQIASNLPDAFTDYKGVIKSFNSAVNAPCRVEIPIKTTLPPNRGRASQ